MPNCFSLTRKGESKPTNLVDVDEELCEFLGVETHPEEWVAHWYEAVGFGLALGCTFEDLWTNFEDEDLREIIEYLDENFEARCWIERR